MKEKFSLPRLNHLKRTSVLAAGLLAFLPGIGFAKLGYHLSLWWLLFVGLLMAMSLRRLQPVAIIYFVVLTFIAGLGGMVASSVAGWLAWPGRILLTYMLDVIALLARIPHAAVSHSIPLYYMAALYALTVVLCIILWHKTRQKDGTITGIELETE